MTSHHMGDDSVGVPGLLRRGGLSFLGGVLAGVLGLVLTIIVSRGFGPEGSGVFFSVVAVTMVLSNTMELGADTAFVWMLPRLRATGRADQQRHALRLGFAPVLTASALTAAVLWLASDWLAGVLGGGSATAEGLRWAALAVLLGTLATVAVSATRGFGMLWPFLLLQNVLLPVLRVCAVGLAVVLGGTVVTALAGWSLAWAVVGVVAVVAALLLARRTPHAVRADAELSREFWGFAVPRGLAAVVEIALVWVDVLMVTIIRGPAEAGIYAVVSRFVTTGALGENALRIALAPRFSALFAAGNRAGAQRLLRAGTPLMIALTWPIFIVAAAEAEDLLAIFGPGFESGAGALRILCLAMIVVALLGPVQSVLLMSGNTRLQLANKVAALGAQVGLNLILIPRWGIQGAAVAWAASVLIDNGLAALQLHRLEGVTPGGIRVLWSALLVGGGCVIAIFVVSLLGIAGITALIAAAALAGLWVAALFLVPRSPLNLVRMREDEVL